MAIKTICDGEIRALELLAQIPPERKIALREELRRLSNIFGVYGEQFDQRIRELNVFCHSLEEEVGDPQRLHATRPDGM